VGASLLAKNPPQSNELSETPVARELAPARLRSSRKTSRQGVSGKTRLSGFGAAPQPGGSKLPRHKSSSHQDSAQALGLAFLGFKYFINP
jgi:hypothetical protein